MGLTEPVAKGCRQGRAEPPELRNIVLGGALGLVCRDSERLGYGVRLTFLTGGPGGAQLRNRAEADGCVIHIAYADDPLLAAESYCVVQHMTFMLRGAVASKGLAISFRCGANSRATAYASAPDGSPWKPE